MRTCLICHAEFQEGENLIANTMETFVFKGAHIPDTVNPAKVTPQELLDSRKEHTKTVMANQYIRYREGILTDAHLNIRHMACSVQKTGASSSPRHPVVKHMARFQRTSVRRR